MGWVFKWLTRKEALVDLVVRTILLIAWLWGPSQSARAQIWVSCRDLDRRDWVAYLIALTTCRQVIFGKNYQSNQVHSFLCVLSSFTLMSLCNLPVHFYPRTVFEMLCHTFLWMWVQKLRLHKWRHQHKIRQNGGQPLLFAASAWGWASRFLKLRPRRPPMHSIAAKGTYLK